MLNHSNIFYLRSKPLLNRFYLLILLFLLPIAHSKLYAGERLIATGGVMQIEGAAGGGLSPWALIAGYGTRGEIGGSSFYTHARTQGGYEMNLGGAAVGFNNRVEISYSHQRLGLSDTVPNENVRMHSVGAKVRLFGDAVYDQDTWMPQVSVGMQLKHNVDFNKVPKALGAERASGIDFYIAATKLYMDAIVGRNVLINTTLQATKANQFGLLGFGGDKHDGYQLQPAVSVAIMLRDDLLLGTEYRAKPNNLSTFKEDDAHDFFLAWFPTKNFALTAAYVNLGNIADKDDQNAWYLSGQISY
ncbi:MAG: hypothetical protein CTY33_05145 [Methylotenera sp.]|nr:MAG: hypothetical protein CTY33_05145 [Methylotenera sp.]